MNSQRINDRRRKWTLEKHPDPKMQEIVMLLRAGVPYRDIAKQFNITFQRVYAIRKSAGLPSRYGRQA